MLEKLADASKAILIPTIILYFCGFLSIEAYVARFGIVIFDVVNARFLIAGFYPFISLSISTLVAWNIYTNCPSLDQFFSAPGLRYFHYVFFIAFNLIASITLAAVCRFGAYSSPMDGQLLMSSPPASDFDVIGKFVSLLNIGVPGLPRFVIKWGLYIFIYSTVVVTLVLLIISLFRYLNNRKPRTPQQVGERPSQSVQSHLAGAIVRTLQQPLSYKRKYLIILVDILFFSLFAAVFIYSFIKVQVSLFDFTSFQQPSLVTNGLMFAWVFTSSANVFIFLSCWYTWLPLFKSGGLNLKEIHITNVQPVIFTLFLPVVTSLFTFGAAIFPRIPFSIGGGEPREIVLKTKLPDDALNDAKLYWIGESGQFLFFVDPKSSSDRALQINKDAVEFIETKKKPAT
jgi:hypothetical protein